MEQRHDEINRHLGEVVAVSFEPVGKLCWLVDDLSLSFPILSDPAKKSYTEYGLGSESFWRVYGPRVIWAYIKLILKGRRLRLPQSDTRQLGGDFIIDADGVLSYVHPQKGPEDRPRLKELLETVMNLSPGSSDAGR